MKVAMLNPRTGELKRIKVGWSWILFFFSGFAGIPLLLRRLYLWAAVVVFGNIGLAMIVDNMDPNDKAYPTAIFVTLAFQTALAAFIAMKGNELTGKNLLEKGWTFADPDSFEAQYARRKWDLAFALKIRVEPQA